MLPELLPIYSASLARDPHLVIKFACRVALFAHNEEDRIGAALTSILNSFTAEDDLRVHVLVNGSTDGTIEIVRSFARSHPSIVPVELRIGDKCNAWNYYVYHLADESPCHFFMDGDVRCPPGVLERMWRELAANPEATVIAGAPLSGRNQKYYRDIQRRWNWVFGNLYGVAAHRLRRIVDLGLKLPLGLRGNDHIITQLLTGDLPAREPREPARMIVRPDLGYEFDPLQPYRLRDLKSYWRRQVTYCLRQFQIGELEKDLDHLPRTMDEINKKILADLNRRWLSPLRITDRVVRQRLRRMYPSPDSVYYESMLDETG